MNFLRRCLAWRRFTQKKISRCRSCQWAVINISDIVTLELQKKKSSRAAVAAK